MGMGRMVKTYTGVYLAEERSWFAAAEILLQIIITCINSSVRSESGRWTWASFPELSFRFFFFFLSTLAADMFVLFASTMVETHTHARTRFCYCELQLTRDQRSDLSFCPHWVIYYYDNQTDIFLRKE